MTKAMVAVVIVLGLAAAGAQEAPRRTHLVIVVDGLRPDYVTPEVMPRLTALGQRGIVFSAHHSVFPTVTRVNASSFVTGAYPEAHGLMGNTIYIPRANATRGLDTGKRENLEDVERAEGRLLTSPTLSEMLRAGGQVAARREQRVERRDVSAEPHARDRRHHPLRVQPPRRARGGGRSGPRTCAGRRHAERWPESVRRRRLPQAGARRAASRT